MKGNNGKGNIQQRDEWETPQDLWENLDEQYNFTFDCCADSQNTKTNLFSYQFQNINEKSIKVETCWMNPPYTIAKEMFEHFFNVVTKGVAIYRCDNMETKLWQNSILENAEWVFIPKGRIQYEGMNGTSCRFPSALIGVNVEPPKNIEGKTVWLRKTQ